MDFKHFPKLETAVQWLKKEKQCEIVGIEICEGAKPLASAPFKGPTAFLVGNEGHGLTPEEMAVCDWFVSHLVKCWNFKHEHWRFDLNQFLQVCLHSATRLWNCLSKRRSGHKHCALLVRTVGKVSGSSTRRIQVRPRPPTSTNSTKRACCKGNTGREGSTKGVGAHNSGARSRFRDGLVCGMTRQSTAASDLFKSSKRRCCCSSRNYVPRSPRE